MSDSYEWSGRVTDIDFSGKRPIVRIEVLTDDAPIHGGPVIVTPVTGGGGH